MSNLLIFLFFLLLEHEVNAFLVALHGLAPRQQLAQSHVLGEAVVRGNRHRTSQALGERWGWVRERKREMDRGG